MSLCGQHYLFSDTARDWYEARELCTLYGGYMARVESRHENNCLVRHAMQEGLHSSWWHSGKYDQLIKIYLARQI